MGSGLLCCPKGCTKLVTALPSDCFCTSAEKPARDFRHEEIQAAALSKHGPGCRWAVDSSAATVASATVPKADLHSPLAMSAPLLQSLHVLSEKVRPYVRAWHAICISGGYVRPAAYAWAGLQMGSAPLLQLWRAYLHRRRPAVFLWQCLACCCDACECFCRSKHQELAG